MKLKFNQYCKSKQRLFAWSVIEQTLIFVYNITMGISERREREKIERRKTILNCARELILLQGVQNVSMEDIAKRAELSKATVYLYFPSKNILLNEICEEAARVFLEKLKPFQESGASGITALKYFWQGYVELFGNSDEIIIIFQVRNFMNPGLPIVSMEEQINSPYVDTIIDTMKIIIGQCKAEGIFDSNLNDDMATRLLLSVFSIIIESAARIPSEARDPSIIMEEMKTAFQILIRGFAKDGIERSFLNIEGMM
jgi:AcrR family transcriptional regulator